MKKQKLELTWIGKDNRPKLEPRILLEDPEKSYHVPHRITDRDLFDNRLIFGDNLVNGATMITALKLRIYPRRRQSRYSWNLTLLGQEQQSQWTLKRATHENIKTHHI